MTPFPDIYRIYRICRIYRIYRICRENSGWLIWSSNYNGLGTFGPESDAQFLHNFDFQGRIYLKVEMPCLQTKTIFWFSGPNLAKTWKTYFFKSSADLRSPPGRPRSSPGVPRESKELPRGSKVLHKILSGHQIYTFKLPINRKAAVTS